MKVTDLEVRYGKISTINCKIMAINSSPTQYLKMEGFLFPFKPGPTLTGWSYQNFEKTA